LYRDATAESGVDVTYRNGEDAGRYAILESLGGGVAVFDYDGDGRQDLFFPGGGFFDGPDKKKVSGYPPKLFRNLGDFKFEDATAAAGLATLADNQPWFYSHGAAVGDYDRDGSPDLLMTGYGRVALWHNEPGPGGVRRFREVTRAAGLLGPHFWSSSAAFGDLDGDGLPDLYMCQYVNCRTRTTRSVTATSPASRETSARRSGTPPCRTPCTGTTGTGRSRTWPRPPGCGRTARTRTTARASASCSWTWTSTASRTCTWRTTPPTTSST
jgi:hypothetical protein